MSSSALMDFSAEFARAFSRGAVDEVMGHYAEDAVLVDGEGLEHRGRAAIEAFLRPLLGRGLTMTSRVRRVIEVGELALVENEFALIAGEKAATEATSVEVLRRERGRWRLAIDCPFGVGRSTHDGAPGLVGAPEFV